MNGMKKMFHIVALLLISVFAHSSLYGVSVLLEGITAGDTRYDAKKLFDGNDDDLCWAFSASNAIKYWQETKSSQGVEIPAGTPLGNPTENYSSDITQTFVDNWINDGGEECNGFDWWFSGNIPMPGDSGGITENASGLKPGATGGGYWLGTQYADGTISVEIDFSGVETDYDLLADVVDSAVDNGCALTCGIYNDDYDGAHAITLWGYEFDDATNEINGLWICDSDNKFLGNFMVDLTWDEDSSIWRLGESSSDSDYTGWYLGDISVLTVGVAVPESSTYAVFFGVFALIFVVLRNRK